MYFNNDAMIYSTKHKVLGAVAMVDYISQTLKVLDEDENEHIIEFEDVTSVLNEVGTLEGVFIYENDVLRSDHSNVLFRVVAEDNGKYGLQPIDKDLRDIPVEKCTSFEDISAFEGALKLVGNFHKLLEDEEKEAYQVLRYTDDVGEVSYMYIMFNDVEEKYDILGLPFFGHKIINDGLYHRNTVTEEELHNILNTPAFKLVDPMELANYVAGVTYGQDIEQVVVVASPKMEANEVDDFGIEDDEDEWDLDDEVTIPFSPKANDGEGICKDCGLPEVTDCNCELWTK